MNSLNRYLERRLAALDAGHLRRHLRCFESGQQSTMVLQGRRLVNFGSNDYLGFASHPALKAAAAEAAAKFGAGSGASRLICGSVPPHWELEDRLAAFKQAEAAITFSSGYAAALGAVGALVGKGDVIVVDQLIHASFIDAVRLSGAAYHIFRHNDCSDLERILRSVRPAGPAPGRPGESNVFVITESLFSMDGDEAPLAEMVRIKDRYGAWLMVDEAHATGLYGSRRTGRVEALGLADAVEVQLGTLGKALGASGGFVTGSRALIDLLANRARSFVFSTAPVPSAAAAAIAAIKLIESEEGRKRSERLWDLVRQFGKTASIAEPRAPIVPWVLGGEEKALEMADRLRGAGMFVPAIRYPTVPRGAARLRISLRADHTFQQVERLAGLLGLKGIE